MLLGVVGSLSLAMASTSCPEVKLQTFTKITESYKTNGRENNVEPSESQTRRHIEQNRRSWSCFLPATRGARIDPMVSLRSEQPLIEEPRQRPRSSIRLAPFVKEDVSVPTSVPSLVS